VNTLSNTPTPKLRVFAFKNVVRFARKFHISDEGVWNAMRARPDADLGAGVYKYRIARPGEGSRGGGRILVALKIGSRAILMFAWEKKDMENLKPKELKAYRDIARVYLGYSDTQMAKLVKNRVLDEIIPPQEGGQNG
jgi:hypothetical protein